MRSIRGAIALAILIAAPQVVRAEDPATAENSMIGPEFNLRSKLHWAGFALNGGLAPVWAAIGEGDPGERLVSVMLIEQMYRKHLTMCRQSGKCKVTRYFGKNLRDWWINGGYTVTYDDGYWFQFTKDPYVVEVRAKPLSLADYHKQADRVQRDLLDVAASVGLRTATVVSNSSAGHLNFGVRQMFGGDARLFRNFLVDFVNHSELSTGILRDSSANKPIMADPAKYARFKEVIARFDRGEITTIKDLARAMNEYVYQGKPKYNALSLLSFIENPDNPEKWRVEIRAVRAQATMAEYLAQSSLILGRVRHLNRQGGLVALDPHRAPIGDTVEGVEKFRQYVVESGEPWETHQALLPGRYQRVTFDELGRGTLPSRTFLARCQDAWGKFTGF